MDLLTWVNWYTLLYIVCSKHSCNMEIAITCRWKHAKNFDLSVFQGKLNLENTEIISLMHNLSHFCNILQWNVPKVWILKEKMNNSFTWEYCRHKPDCSSQKLPWRWWVPWSSLSSPPWLWCLWKTKVKMVSIKM